MKQLNFMQEVKLVLDNWNYQDYSQGFLAIEDALEKYSQPFKPELITEMFENIDCSAVYVNEGEPIACRNYNPQLKQKLIAISIKNNPRTLDDFINNCQQAGIELEKREA